MKRTTMVAVAAMLFALGLSAAHADETKADDGRNATLAVGFYSLGGEFTNGTPTMRWKPSDDASYDIAPIVSFSDARTNGPTDTKTQRYGVNVGFVKNLVTMGDVVAGLRFEGGYDSRYDILSSASHPFSARGSGYDYSLGLGPDFEFFIPGLSNVSLGAQAVFGYTESRHRILSTTATYQRDSTVGFHGSEFTLRYYFR